MSSSWALMANAAITSLIIVAGFRYYKNPVVRVLIAFQCLYWAVSYLGRGILLGVVEPRPRMNDSIADPRLLSGSSYSSALGEVLWIVNLGLLAYLVALVIIRKISPSVREWAQSTTLPAFTVPVFLAWLVYAFGWVCRVLLLAGVGGNSLVSSLALFGPLGVGVLLTQAPIGYERRRYALLVGFLVVAELVHAALIQSKTPIMAVLLLSVLGLVKRGWRFRWPLVLVTAGLFLIFFFVLQEVKIDPKDRTDLSLVDSTYPSLVRPLLPILRRFDLLSAATDAWAKPSMTWLGWDYFLRAARGLFPWATPASWTPSGTPGAAWPAEVRAASMPSAGHEVYLADGFAAEGYAWLGLFGVVLLGIVFACLALAVSRLLTRGTPIWTSVALLLLYEPILLERGLLGAAAAVGQDIQAAVAFWLLWLLLGPKKSPGAGQCGSHPLRSGFRSSP